MTDQLRKQGLGFHGWGPWFSLSRERLGFSAPAFHPSAPGLAKSCMPSIPPTGPPNAPPKPPEKGSTTQLHTSVYAERLGGLARAEEQGKAPLVQQLV